MRLLLATYLMLTPWAALADTPNIRAIITNHVLPGYQRLADEAEKLAKTATETCAPESAELVSAYHGAFDAWITVSHLRFGPSEADDRAFALAFWPDPRGSTPKTLATLMRDADPVVSTPEAFTTVSVAARGFYALEFLLFDPQIAATDASDYHCALVRAVTVDIARNATAILDRWQGGYGDLMAVPDNNTYRTSTEAVQQFFTVLSTALEFTSDTRLGRPMGTFDRPRPNRSEARRSGRSLQHVILSLTATRELASLLSMNDATLERAFDAAIRRAKDLDDPVFAGVTDPQGRLRIEVLKQDIDTIRQLLAEAIGPNLGIAAGFNSLDGD